MNICVFQGTFNPIHKAHIRIAKYVMDKYNFDKLIFIPAYKPPHKDYDTKMSEHRLNMVNLAIKALNNDKFTVSDIEYKREDKSYTYITICELYKLYDIDDKIKFIIGTDAFRHIESWYKTDELKKLVKFIVFKRENNFSPLEYNYLKDKGYDYEIEDLSFEDVSSTDLRASLKNHKNANKYLYKEVEEYIKNYGLYETQN